MDGENGRNAGAFSTNPFEGFWGFGMEFRMAYFLNCDVAIA
jgi:hypothetical protein